MKAKTEPKITLFIDPLDGVYHSNMKVELLEDNKLLVSYSAAVGGTMIYLFNLEGNLLDYNKAFGNYTYLACLNQKLLSFIPTNLAGPLIALDKDTLKRNDSVNLRCDADTLYTVIDKQLAALCSHTDVYEQTHWTITLYDDKFRPQEPIYLLDLIPYGVTIKTIKQLNNGLIVLECSNHTLYLLEKITEPSSHFIKRGALTLLVVGQAWVALTNGDILLYDRFGVTPQLWDGESVKPITAFGFNPDSSDEKLSNIHSIQKVSPMIDGKHLIVKTGYGIKLHHLQTGVRKTIDLGNQSGSDYQVLADGKVFMRGRKGYDAMSLFLAEFQENLDYKKTYPKDLVQNYCFFNQKATKDGVPGDVKTIIYTFLIQALLREQPYLLKRYK